MQPNALKSQYSSKEVSNLSEPNEENFPLIIDASPIAQVEQVDDYYNLSFSIISEEGQDNKSNNDLISSVKKNLAELRNEAKLYLQTGDLAIQEANKKLKESIFSADSAGPDQETTNIINEMRQSIQFLHNRLEKNEELFSTKRSENQQLQEILTALENKIKEQTYLDQSKKQVKCGCFIF